MSDWHIYKTKEQVAEACADYLATQIEQCVEQRGVCHVALPGGNSPVPCLARLAQKNLPWEKIHWYLGDERSLPVGDAERNDTMIKQHLWSKIDAPEQNMHSAPTELGTEAAAEKYNRLIESVGTLDIVMLGVGEDGHTASLFPGNAALQNTDFVTAVYNSPKPPAERISLSLPVIQQARLRVVLTTGAGKAGAIQQVKAGEPLPVGLIGDAQWFVDEASII